MLTFIWLGALVIVAVLVGFLVVRGNSSAGKGKSGTNAESAGRTSAEQPKSRAGGLD